MSAAPDIDVRDLNSVRRAADRLRQADAAAGQVVIGDDFQEQAAGEARQRRRRGLLALNRSPLARKIVTFNLIGLTVLVSGMLFFAPSRENLAHQRASGLVSEALLIANAVEARMPAAAPVNLLTGDGLDPVEALQSLNLRGGIEVFLFDTTNALVARASAAGEAEVAGLGQDDASPTVLTDLLNRVWGAIGGLTGASNPPPQTDPLDLATEISPRAQTSGTSIEPRIDAQGRMIFAVSTPVRQNGVTVGSLVLTSAPGEIDALARGEREQILKMFVVGLLVSFGLSMVLASTIANPIADLAAAAESGRDRNARKMSPTRVRIPDLSARPDEIGRLSEAMRGMVNALYERIDSNEQFAADVAHEIKNPLASLRSAVGTMRIAKREDQREKMLEIIEHDVVRLDRLVTDISTASRLDSELVKEEERAFDLVRMLGNLNEHLGAQAQAKGIDFISDLPADPVVIQGLEGRLAQVFVNLITNATSFCEAGDAIRVWARKRENRVLVVVEDTGPGIPEGALQKIFQRFYSERPADHFGNNSGLGLAISKQIVEAHGGVIWAENIQPTESDIVSDPLGARFVVGLPI